MDLGLVAYRWTCPICSEQTSSLSTEDKPSIVGQAENALTSHVRTRGGSGHGREGTIPSGFESEDVIEHVDVDDVGIDDDPPSTETPPYA